MNLSGLFKNCHVFSATQSASELLPHNQAAVYAFYEALDFSRGSMIDEVDCFVAKNGRHISMELTEWPFHLKLKFRGNPERFKGEGRRLASELAPELLPEVRNQLHFLSFIGEPLYIGKTENIRKRFLAHHDNGFLWKMKADFARPPNDFVMFAYYTNEQFVRLFESILIQAVNPAFCDQKC